MPHSSSSPYQPLLLRILHGLIGLFVIGAIFTAFWTYDTYDGRWGRISLPQVEAMEGIHGTFGLWSLLVFPVFVIYAFNRGQRRLIQPQSLRKLSQIGKPVWWYTLHQMTNTSAILALTFALFSGKMMGETWLPQGELDHFWYYAHLISWVVLVVAIALHVLMAVRVGGGPLLLSMLNWQFRAKDHPKLWQDHLQQWWLDHKPAILRSWLHSQSLLKGLEISILVIVGAAWVIPLFK